MKFTGNQKNVYILALILLFVSIVLVCAWTFWGNGEDASTDTYPTPAPLPSGTPSVTVAPQTTAADTETLSQKTDAQMVSTIVLPA